MYFQNIYQIAILTKKDQVILLKISDGKGKWHFLALPSVLDNDSVKRPYKSLSRLIIK